MNRLQLSRTAAPIGMLLVLPLTAVPAAARQDPGAPIQQASPLTCLLERVGDQLVRCDLLTGNGVPAPTYIPEQ